MPRPSAILIVGTPSTTVFRRATATRLRTVPMLAPRARAVEWRHRLDESRPGIPAVDAYQGELWNQVRSAWHIAQAENAILFLVSPGLGFVEAQHTAAHYSASFSPDHPDRTGGDDLANQKWWDAMAATNTRAALPTITSAVAAHPGCPVIVALGSHALAAVHADLWEARTVHADPDRFLILAPAAPGTLGLGDSVLRVDAAMDHGLGGTRQSLGARMLRHLVETIPLQAMSVANARHWLATRNTRKTTPRTPASKTPAEPVSLSKIEAFLAAELARDPHARPGALWTRLRDRGWTCDRTFFDRAYQAQAFPLLAPEAPLAP